uniref:Amphiphysin n=1 Tax=Sphenodon punctatus TaxID=8508 RepID=A0A8D0FZH6_SPHPU
MVRTKYAISFPCLASDYPLNSATDRACHRGLLWETILKIIVLVQPGAFVPKGKNDLFREMIHNLLFFFKPLGMQDASKKLTESLHEVYEPEWYGREDVKTVGEFWFWDSFQTRIAKRSRKLVDYDSARHHLEALQGSKRRDEGRITKAEEEFQKAQKVFEDFNTDLQEELPSLWSRRVGFYVTTFKNIYSLEAKFHKEIALLCHKLYEVMTKLGDQHADKAFTIQGAPSDSGPLRISKTPSPPEETSPLPSPEASPNHTLAPASPAPARPKSPSQLRKGPPVPPLPKLTPTKELQQENIISLFDDNFVPEISVTTPSQVSPWKNSLSVHLIPMGQFSYSRFQNSSSTCFQVPRFQMFVNEFSFVYFKKKKKIEAEEAPSLEPKADEPLPVLPPPAPAPAPAAVAAPAAAPAVVAAAAEPEAVPAEPAEPAVEAVVSDQNFMCPRTHLHHLYVPHLHHLCVLITFQPPSPFSSHLNEHSAHLREKLTSIPSVVIEPASNNEGEGEEHEVIVNESKDAVEDISSTQDTESNTSEVVSEPKTIVEIQPASSEDHPVSADGGMPPGFLFKVEALHDFEAANNDELDLKRGDIVLVIPSDTSADQDAGWLTGVKESDWLQYKETVPYKGLFPENFTQRLE